MANPHDDDLMIQASQLFTDAIAAHDVVYQFAETLDITYREYKDGGKKAAELLKPFKTQISTIAQSSIIIAADFQDSLEAFRKTYPKEKLNKGFYNL